MTLELSLARLKRIGSRLIEIGPVQISKILKNKLKQEAFMRIWRTKALQGIAQHHWPQITGNHAIRPEFSHCFSMLKQKKLPFLKMELLNNQVLQQAQEYTQNCFDILGSGKIKFATMPWHEDFRLRKADPNADYCFDGTSFYKDIKITAGITSKICKDIKVPWELSRFHHLPILGTVYEQNKNNPIFAQTFMRHINAWLQENPYLIGINWLCPMEVGIRAINWIWGFMYFKDCPEIPHSFWEQFVCSLYDHAHYLEHNWELYDGKTSNHYLADLIGYFYVCWFFSSIKGFDKKAHWCYQEILHEFDKQIFDEGTSYEGSTAYHKLVTEFFDHCAFLCKEFGFELPQNFYDKLSRMHMFIEQLTTETGYFFTIGDNDSGQLVAGKLNIYSDDPSFGKLRTNRGLPLVPSSPEKGISRGQGGRERDILSPKQTSQLLHELQINLLHSKQTYRGKSLIRSDKNTYYNISEHANSERNFDYSTNKGFNSVLPELTAKGSPYNSRPNHYPNFGISIIKKNPWHVTLRHHAYQSYQPSGHFHNDSLSITLAVNGIPIFIDPGSYIYTPSAQWRNHFRSVAMHNTFFLCNDSISIQAMPEVLEPVPFDERLFAMNIPANRENFSVLFPGDLIALNSWHNLYSSYGLTAHREITCSENNIIMTDFWRTAKHAASLTHLNSCWNFTLHPEIDVFYENNVWHFMHQNNTLMIMQTNLNCTLQDCFISLEYGSKVESKKLYTQKPLDFYKSMFIFELS